MPLGEKRNRAAAVKTAVERALANVERYTSGGGQVGEQGSGGNTPGRPPQRTSVVTKPTAERSASDGVGRVGAFEVQVRPTGVRVESCSVCMIFIVPRSMGSATSILLRLGVGFV